MIPLIQQDMVGAGYMTVSQVTDMVAISQMTPGPVAVNAATFAGMNAMGVGGAVIATIGAVLPCALVSVIVARFFFRSMDSALVQSVLYGMRPVVVSLIAGVMITFAASSLFLPGGWAGAWRGGHICRDFFARARPGDITGGPIFDFRSCGIATLRAVRQYRGCLSWRSCVYMTARNRVP